MNNTSFFWYPCLMLSVELCESGCKASSLPVDRTNIKRGNQGIIV